MLRILSLLLAWSIGLSTVRAGMFAEHKFIGDNAFKLFVGQNGLETYFRDMLGWPRFGSGQLAELPFPNNPRFRDYHQGLFAIPVDTDVITYGDLCGLACDHSIQHVQLLGALEAKDCLFIGTQEGSTYKQLFKDALIALRSHREAIDRGENEGGYLSLEYALLAIEDQSHFHVPPQDMRTMLHVLEGDILPLLWAWSRMEKKEPRTAEEIAAERRAERALLYLNNPAKYALFRLLAETHVMDAAQSEATLISMDRTGAPEAAMATARESLRCAIIRAFIMQAFADHFLQDAFAAGHMTTVRGPGLARSVENKGSHDYYCRVGLDVMNSKGERWHTYGDNFYSTGTGTNDHAIAANLASLNELWAGYARIRELRLKQLQGDTNSLVPRPAWHEANDATPARYHLVDTVLARYHAYDLAPLPLGPSRYEEEILLKRGSKNGPFKELGAQRVLTPDGDRPNIAFHAALGFGYNWRVPGPKSAVIGKPISSRMESILWFGGSVGYAYANLPGRYEHRPQVAIHLSWLDRVVFDQVFGYAIRPGDHGCMAATTLGYEFKSVKCRTAPSIKYVLRHDRSYPPTHGVQLALRIY